MDKNLIRREILVKRAKLGKDNHNMLSGEVVKNVKDSIYYKNAKTIMTFISFGSEIDTHNFIKSALKEGKNIVVPVTFHENKVIKPSKVLDFSELEPGYFNILTPKEEFIRYVDPSEIDLIIVPGAVFDRDGYRVGYGGGYYDRFLSKINKTVPKVAIAFDLQIIEKVPREELDIPVDFIATEKEIIQCNKFF